MQYLINTLLVCLFSFSLTAQSVNVPDYAMLGDSCGTISYVVLPNNVKTSEFQVLLPAGTYNSIEVYPYVSDSTLVPPNPATSFTLDIEYEVMTGPLNVVHTPVSPTQVHTGSVSFPSWIQTVLAQNVPIRRETNANWVINLSSPIVVPSTGPVWMEFVFNTNPFSQPVILEAYYGDQTSLGAGSQGKTSPYLTTPCNVPIPDFVFCSAASLGAYQFSYFRSGTTPPGKTDFLLVGNELNPPYLHTFPNGMICPILTDAAIAVLPFSYPFNNLTFSLPYDPGLAGFMFYMQDIRIDNATGDFDGIGTAFTAGYPKSYFLSGTPFDFFQKDRISNPGSPMLMPFMTFHP